MNIENHNSVENIKAASPRRISDLSFGYDFHPEERGENFLCLNIQYTPLIQKTDGSFSSVSQLSGYVSVDWGRNLPPEIYQKLETLQRVVMSFLPSYEINVGGSLKIQPTIREIFCHYYTKPPKGVPSQLSALYFFSTAPNQTTQANLEWDSLSRSQQLVVSNVASWVKEQAWEDLANRIRVISGQPVEAIKAHKVFVSYKRRSKSEPVAETIAHRLSQQHIEVWLDKWEIKAGDSVPSKIGEGFKDSDACLVFLERQYSSSDWCTKEMNTALTKAINENLTVIPILVEDCDMPELLKDLKPVYLKDPSATEFEQRVAEITDAIYKVDLNPYR